MYVPYRVLTSSIRQIERWSAKGSKVAMLCRPHNKIISLDLYTYQIVTRQVTLMCHYALQATQNTLRNILLFFRVQSKKMLLLHRREYIGITPTVQRSMLYFNATQRGDSGVRADTLTTYHCGEGGGFALSNKTNLSKPVSQPDIF